MRLNQDLIQRMFDGRGGVAGGGSSLDPGLINGLATEMWTEENYVSKTFFNELFVIHKKTTTTVYDGDTVVSTTTDTSGTFAPNEIPSQEESTDEETGYRTVVVTEVDNIEAKKGLWTDFFLSALGLNGSGGGGGIGDVTWQALGDNTDTRQIASSHLTTALGSALAGYATQSWVTSQNYVTSSAISDMATKTWVNNQSFVNWTALGDTTTTQQIALSHLTTALSGYATQTWVTNNFSTPSTVATQMQTYAKIQNGTITIGDTSLTPITSVTGTFWGKSFTNGGTVNGTIKAGTSGGAIEQFHSVEMNSAGTLAGYGGFIDFHYYASGSTFDSTLDYTSRIIESEVGVISILAKNNDATNANKLAGLLVGAGYDGSYVQIGDLRIVYDSTNNALKVVKLVSGSEVAANFYATGSVSALGYGAGGGGGTGDVTWTNLADNSDTRPIALSHLTGALAGYATTSQLAGYLPLTGGTLTGSLNIGTGTTERVQFYKYNKSSLAGYLAWTENEMGNYIELYNPLTLRGLFLSDSNTTAPLFYNGNLGRLYTLWHSGNDGAGSGLDADLVDGLHASDFHRYYRHTTPEHQSSTFDANNLEDGWHDFYCYVLNVATLSNHGTLIQNSYCGTPFQLWIPDTGYYIYKRYNTGTVGGTWSKIYAGYADTAGSAAALSSTYYWANVAISTTSQTGLTPTFKETILNVDSSIQNTARYLLKDGNTILGYCAYTKNQTGEYIELWNAKTKRGIYIGDMDTTTPLYNYGNSANTLYKMLHEGNIGSYITNYYWANVKISATSDSATTPTFKNVVLDGKVMGDNDAAVQITGTKAGTWNYALSALATNLSQGNRFMIGLGYKFTHYNFGGLEFYFDGEDSTSNMIGLGIHSVNHVLTVSAAGNVGIGLGTTPASYKLHVAGAIYSTSSVTGTSFVKTNGTSAQFLKADGSVDSNSYALASSLTSYLPLTGGVLTGAVYMKENAVTQKFQFYKKDATRLAGYLAWTENTTDDYLELYNPISQRGIWLRTDVPEAPIYYLGSSSSQTNKIIHEAIIDNYIGQYYWANVKVSKTSSTTETPTFGRTKIIDTGDSWAMRSFGVMCPNLSAAKRAGFIYTGMEDSARNMGQIYFRYSGTKGSTDNSLSFGLHSVDDVLNIMGSGNVGIGTLSPPYKLSVYSDSTTEGNIAVLHSEATFDSLVFDLKNYHTWSLACGNNNGFWIWNTNGYVVDITSDGKFGIGTRSPSQKLDVNGHSHFGGSLYIDSVATGNYNEGIRVANTKDSSYCTICLGVDPTVLVGTHANQWQIGRDSSNHFFWNCGGTVLMRFLKTGNLGIGTSSPSYKLHVEGSFYNSGDTLLGSNVSNTTTVYHKMVVGAANYTNSPYVQIGKIRFVYNDNDNAIRVVREDGTAANLYATGGISALGYQSGGGGGGSTGVFSTSITPDTTGVYDLGTSTYKWRNLYLAGANGGNGFSIITTYNSYVYIGSVGKVHFGSSDVEFEDTVYVENRMGIGTKNGNYDLYVYGENEGNAYFKGDVSVASLTNRSDMRLKDVVGDVNLSVQQIASAPTFKFRFKEKAKRTMVGTSAQYWDAVLPESVTRDADGMLGLDYGVTALVSTIILAKGMNEHERRITKLEKENAELRARIKDLEEN